MERFEFTLYGNIDTQGVFEQEFFASMKKRAITIDTLNELCAKFHNDDTDTNKKVLFYVACSPESVRDSFFTPGLTENEIIESFVFPKELEETNKFKLDELLINTEIKDQRAFEVEVTKRMGFMKAIHTNLRVYAADSLHKMSKLNDNDPAHIGVHKFFESSENYRGLLNLHKNPHHEDDREEFRFRMLLLAYHLGLVITDVKHPLMNMVDDEKVFYLLINRYLRTELDWQAPDFINEEPHEFTTGVFNALIKESRMA